MDDDFSSWYRTHHAVVVNIVAAATGERDVAADAAGDAFVRALERWNDVSTMESRDGWVTRVALNAAKRRLRRRNLERRLTFQKAPGQSTPSGATEEFWELVRPLPRRQRQAVVLRHVGQFKEAEIAVSMGVRRGTVSRTLADAYNALRDAVVEAQTAETIDRKRVPCES